MAKSIKKNQNKFINKLKTILPFFRKKLNRRRVIVIGIILVILIIIKSFTSSKPLAVEVTKVEIGNLTDSISTSGKIKADQIATLTFPTAGKVAWVGVNEGQKVYKWQAIASLDKTLLDTAYQQARSNLRAAEATLERIYDSIKGQAVGESFIAKDNRTSAEVAKDNAFDALRAAKYNLENATIIAPFSGIIVQADPSFAGVNVNPATSSYVLINPNSFYFEAQVNQADIAKIKVGQKAVIRLDSYPDKQIQTTVKQTSLTSVTTSTGGTAYKVRMLLNGQDLDLRQDMDGDAEFLLSTVENVLLVPSTALVEEKEKSFVYVVEENRVRKTEVEIDASSVDYIQITSGLSEGQIIVTLPPATIKDNAKIKIS
jgi:membrane fusion protein (multidrug efflux system)